MKTLKEYTMPRPDADDGLADVLAVGADVLHRHRADEAGDARRGTRRP